MIRDAHLQSIHQAIAKHRSGRFQEVDFKIEPHASDYPGYDSFIVSYEYADYSFLCEISTEPMSLDGSRKMHHVMKLTTVPGEALHAEVRSIVGVNSMISELSKWLDRMDEELQATPIAREVARHRAELDALMERMAAVEDGMFTREEAARTEQMIRDMQDKLEALATDNAEVTEQVEKLIGELEALRSEIPTAPSKVKWYRKIYSRVLGIASHPVVQKLALKVAEHEADKIADKLLPK